MVDSEIDVFKLKQSASVRVYAGEQRLTRGVHVNCVSSETSSRSRCERITPISGSSSTPRFCLVLKARLKGAKGEAFWDVVVGFRSSLSVGITGGIYDVACCC